MAKKVLGNSVTEFSILEISGAKNPGIFCPLKKKSWNFLKKKFLNSMKNWYSWNFLVPEFSILEYSVWKFSVLGFYFPENSGILWEDLKQLKRANKRVCSELQVRAKT